MASTSTTGLSASDRARSRSWIIRSSTMLTSVDRKVYVPGAHGFDVLRASQVREHGVPGGIESFHMADLQHEVVAAGQRDQAIGLGDGTGDRLFDQHMHAVAEQLFGHFVMVCGGGGDDGRVDAAVAAPSWSGQAGSAAFGGHALAGGQQRVDDSHQFHVVERLEQTGVDASQMTTSHDGHTQSVHAAFLRSRPRP